MAIYFLGTFPNNQQNIVQQIITVGTLPNSQQIFVQQIITAVQAISWVRIRERENGVGIFYFF
jgi:hypothetical protein